MFQVRMVHANAATQDHEVVGKTSFFMEAGEPRFQVGGFRRGETTTGADAKLE
jgi:hypothetical protein|tara:strand:+ start:4141 stop:4299 length:159 start_codon:yes stop_codon:yes gene_type:complete